MFMSPKKNIVSKKWVANVDHELHFLSGIGNLLAYVGGFLIFVGGLYVSVIKLLPDYEAVFLSHRWVFSATVVWFVISITLLYKIFSSRKYKNLVNRLGATCAENMSEQDYTYSERRKIIKTYSPEFNRSKKILVLGATGFHTFAKPGDQREDEDNSALLRPVLEALSNDKTRCDNVEVDILLLHPDSKYAEERVKTLHPSQTLAEYKEEIRISLLECQKFKKEIPKLRCFVYDRPLIWKLIITDDFAWQQFYKEGTHAEHSRINIFSNITESGNALYHPFLKLFELLRDSAASEVDLSQNSLRIPVL